MAIFPSVFALLLLAYSFVQGAVIESSTCNAAHVATVKSDVLHPVYFCTFYLDAGRSRSPISGLTVSELLSACACIKAAAPKQTVPIYTSTSTAHAKSCVESNVALVKKEYTNPTAFCKFLFAYSPRDQSAVPGLNLPALDWACKCILTSATSTSSVSSISSRRSSTSTKTASATSSHVTSSSSSSISSRASSANSRSLSSSKTSSFTSSKSSSSSTGCGTYNTVTSYYTATSTHTPKAYTANVTLTITAQNYTVTETFTEPITTYTTETNIDVQISITSTTTSTSTSSVTCYGTSAANRLEARATSHTTAVSTTNPACIRKASSTITSILTLAPATSTITVFQTVHPTVTMDTLVNTTFIQVTNMTVTTSTTTTAAMVATATTGGGLSYYQYTNPYTESNNDGALTYVETSAFRTTPLRSGLIQDLRTINTNWPEGVDCTLPGYTTMNCGTIALVFQGYFWAQAGAGTYTFLTEVKDDNLFFVWTGANAEGDAWVNGNEDYDHSYSQAAASAEYTLTADEYLPVTFLWLNTGGPGEILFDIYLPDGTHVTDTTGWFVPSASCDASTSPFVE